MRSFLFMPLLERTKILRLENVGSVGIGPLQTFFANICRRWK